MKPARSPQSTACLRTWAQTARTVACTSSAVRTVRTTSTSFIAGAGLKKCMPITSSGREVARAIAITGSEEVVVASTAPGLQTLSSAWNSSCFTARSSATASTARSTSAKASSEPAAVIRSTVAAAASSVSRPRSTARLRDLPIAAFAASAFSWLRAASTTGKPACAKTCAIPLAMVPEPATPTEFTGRLARTRSPSGGVCRSRTMTWLPGPSYV